MKTIFLLFTILLFTSCSDELEQSNKTLLSEKMELTNEKLTLLSEINLLKKEIEDQNKKFRMLRNTSGKILTEEGDLRNYITETAGVILPSGYSIIEGYYKKEIKNIYSGNDTFEDIKLTYFYITKADSEIINSLKKVKLDIYKYDTQDNIGFVVSLNMMSSSRIEVIENSSLRNIVEVLALFPQRAPRGNVDRMSIAYIY